MRFTDILATSLVAPLVAAHGGMSILGLPRDAVAKLKAREGSNKHARRVAQPAPRLSKRQGGLDGRCGPTAGGAVCDPGYCCSAAGWCGVGPDYCMAPDCLLEYGPACDANTLPSGGTTREIARPQLNPNIEYGVGLYDCTEPGTVAITYDDGPYIYTNDVLDQFAAYGFKATFFITGININKGSIDDETKPWPAIIRRMIAEGHQVASHTWSHQNLDQSTSEQRYEQMIRNEMAIANILGKFPTYMRPPYSACITPACEEDMKDLGYVNTFFDLDTDDYNNITPELVQNAKNNFANAINPSNPAADEFLAIAHDIHEQTARNLTGYMLDLLVAKGYRGVTVGECLGDPEANWYRTGQRVPTSTPSLPTVSATSTSTLSAPQSSPTANTPDGTCGGSTGFTCIGFELGECCSQYGYCGSTSDHCGTGCQELFGNCGGSSPSSSAVITTTTSSSVVSSTESSTTSSPAATPSVISTDGTCGGANGYTCAGSEFGDCCSYYGWCGSSELHCSTEISEPCNPLFGECGSSGASPGSSSEVFTTSTATETQTPVIPTPTEPASEVSEDGTCGGENGYTCKGFWHEGAVRECCSKHGWCGSTQGHCGEGCNGEFGNCGSEYIKLTRRQRA